MRGTAAGSRWRAKYGGLQVSDAKRLKVIEDENRRLKKLVADSWSTMRCRKTSRDENGDDHSAARRRHHLVAGFPTSEQARVRAAPAA